MPEQTNTLLDQAREAYAADKCPACGMSKRSRQDWFCKGCWWKLDKKTRAIIDNQWRGWTIVWFQALQSLKKLYEEKVG